MYKTDFVCTYKAFEELEDDDVNAGPGAHLGDAAAHLSGTDDTDAVDR